MSQAIALIDGDRLRRSQIALVLTTGGGFDVRAFDTLDAARQHLNDIVLVLCEAQQCPLRWQPTSIPLLSFSDNLVESLPSVAHFNLTAQPLPALAEFVRKQLPTRGS